MFVVSLIEIDLKLLHHEYYGGLRWYEMGPDKNALVQQKSGNAVLFPPCNANYISLFAICHNL